MEYPKMLYKLGGPNAEPIHGAELGTLIVQDEDGELAALDDGWHLTTPEALAPQAEDDDGAPTRAELEAKAAELGIKPDGRWSDKRLGDAIEAALLAK